MNDIFRQIFEPRRNVRGPRPPSPKDDAAWAETLDWQRNDYDFHRLVRRLSERLDSHYRNEFGLRLDQLADRAEMTTAARRPASWYHRAEQRYRTVGILEYLYRELDRLVSKRARQVFDRRRKVAEDLLTAPQQKQPHCSKLMGTTLSGLSRHRARGQEVK